MKTIVKFKKLHKDAKEPIYKTEGSVGADLFSVEDVDILPGKWKVISTGLAVSLSHNIEMQIRPRSGLAFNHGVTVLNSPATIDSDYRGDLKIMLINHGSKIFCVNKGDRIAQAVLNKVELGNYQECKELSVTKRGIGGLGSTGIN